LENKLLQNRPIRALGTRESNENALKSLRNRLKHRKHAGGREPNAIVSIYRIKPVLKPTNEGVKAPPAGLKAHGTSRRVVLRRCCRSTSPKTGAPLLDLPPDGTFQGCATAVLQIDGEPIHLLSPTSLLAANEHRLLADFGAMSRARLRHFEEHREAGT
jgi:hypothetical protein